MFVLLVDGEAVASADNRYSLGGFAILFCDCQREKIEIVEREEEEGNQ